MKKFVKTLLVAMTGYGQETDRQKSKEAGFDHHLVKPVDFGELRNILADGRYDGVIASASSPERVAQLRMVVEEVRRAGPEGMVVAVGGYILQTGIDVRAATGADFATGDLELVLDACGIRSDGAPARLRA